MMKNIGGEAKYYLEKFFAGRLDAIDWRNMNWDAKASLRLYIGKDRDPDNLFYCATVGFGRIQIGNCYDKTGQYVRNPEMILERIAGEYFIQRYINTVDDVALEFFRHDLRMNIMQMPEYERQQAEYSDYLLSWLRNVTAEKLDKDKACRHCGKFGLLTDISRLRDIYICTSCGKEIE